MRVGFMQDVIAPQLAKPATKVLARRRHRATKPPKLTPDQRTRVARHGRELERYYRALLEAQGREIDLHTDMLIGNLASTVVHVRVARAALSRGTLANDEQLQRWLGLALRLARQLGLKASAIEPPKAQPKRPLGSVLRDGTAP
jgi:hypothetical protein